MSFNSFMVNVESLDERKVNRSRRLVDGVPKWILDDHTFKFILVPDAGRILLKGLTLVIAPIRCHIALYAVYKTLTLDGHEAEQECEKVFQELMSGRRRIDRLIVGAGNANVRGDVTNWKSSGFNVETPVELRGEIQGEVRGCIGGTYSSRHEHEWYPDLRRGF